MQNLYEQQNALDDEIRETQDDQSNMNRLAQEEQRNLDEFENILSLIEDASELIDPFNENSSQELYSLSDSNLSEEIESNFDSVIQNLSSQSTICIRDDGKISRPLTEHALSIIARGTIKK